MGMRRETAKSERRQRIIRAARELISETGDAGLSMRALAARAGVSLATPYNLFGSKRAVLVAVLEDLRGFDHDFAATTDISPLDKVLLAVRIAVSYYEKDPEFYRALWSSILGAGGTEDRSAIFNPKRDAFWRSLLDDAQAQGVLLPGIQTDALLRSLDYSLRSVMLHWLLGEIEVDGLQAAVGYGHALILRGAAAADAQGLMQQRVLDFQAAMQTAAPPQPGQAPQEGTTADA